MEIKVSKVNFLKAASLVGGVAAQKANTLPILGNVLLETTSRGELRLVGTDLEVGISTTLPVEVMKEGSITVPAKKINEIVRELPEGEMEITVSKNNTVNIKAGKAYFKIIGLTKDDYPKLPEWSSKDVIEFEQAPLKECLTLTSFAISYDETRYVLNGVLLSVKGNRIRFVATDGRRLAYMEKEFKNKSGKEFDMIIPAKAVQELIKILSWDGNVQIVPSQNQAIFNLGETYLVSRLIEGNFPNYEQVIPKGEKTKAQVKREDFLQAIRRTSLLTSPDSPAVKLDFVKGKILISSRAPNLGEAKEEIAAEITGDEVTIGFNPNYLMDALKNMDIENISISLTDPDKPGLLRGKDGYLYVVMPMQLN